MTKKEVIYRIEVDSRGHPQAVWRYRGTWEVAQGVYGHFRSRPDDLNEPWHRGMHVFYLNEAPDFDSGGEVLAYFRRKARAREAAISAFLGGNEELGFRGIAEVWFREGNDGSAQ